jgi:hypothetical protein
MEPLQVSTLRASIRFAPRSRERRDGRNTTSRALIAPRLQRHILPTHPKRSLRLRASFYNRRLYVVTMTHAAGIASPAGSSTLFRPQAVQRHHRESLHVTTATAIKKTTIRRLQRPPRVARPELRLRCNGARSNPVRSSESGTNFVFVSREEYTIYQPKGTIK